MLKDKLLALNHLRRAGAFPGLGQAMEMSRMRREYGAAASAAIMAMRHGRKTAIIDDESELSYEELAEDVHRWTNALGDIPREGDGPLTIGLMCRNSQYLVIAIFGAIAAGAKLVFLNTDLGPTMLQAVGERERLDVLVHDAEFATNVAAAGFDCPLIVAAGSAAEDSMRSRIDHAASTQPPKPRQSVQFVILTSGSSGTPKGAARDESSTDQVLMLGGFLQKIPLRPDDRIYVAPPAYHGWGLITVLAGLLIGSTLVFQSRFRAEEAVELMESQQVSVFVAVPTMLSRLMAVPEEQIAPLVGQLRIIGSGGARLDPELVTKVMDRFGPVLHNLYGATEASYITIATPEDLLVDPASAGRPPVGVRLKVLRDGRELPPGETGDIYVRTASQMKGYTDGRSRETHAGLMKLGDTGMIDEGGRLVVQGRADSMIVSGGENIFPEDVEFALLRHRLIEDCKVIGVDDEDFGQRLVAIVVASKLDEKVLSAYLHQELSRAAVPKRYVVVDEIPRTATGKVAMSTIRELVME